MSTGRIVRRPVSVSLVGLAALALAPAVASGSPARPAAAAPLAFVRHVVPAGRYGQILEAVAVGDLDGNGRPDVVVAGDRYLLWYPKPDGPPRLIARGRFGAGAMTLVRDLDGDRRPDVVTGQILPSGARAEVWFANTRHGWRRHVLSTAAYCHDVLFGRFLAGRIEAACVDQHRSRIVLLLPPRAAAAAWSLRTIDPQRSAMGAAAADVDRDGRLDLVAGRSWYRNAGDGHWTRYDYTTLTSSYSDFDDYAKVVALDLNRDGRTDIVASLFAESPAGRVYAFLAPPDPREQEWTPVLLDPGPLFGVHSIAVGRFDGCRRPEVMVAETNIGGWNLGRAPDPHVYVYRLLGSPSDPAGWSRSAVDSIGAHDVQVADLDGDGRPDLVGHEENTDAVQPPRDGQVFWWRNVTPRPSGPAACAGA